MDAIRCQGLSRRYGPVEALKPLDLSVPAGSVFGFLGRNGAGKTTTIRLLTGLARPTTGTAWVAGVEVTSDNRAARENFGYLPEEPAFYTWMTPREFLDYAGRLYSLDPAARRQRAEELLALAGLAGAASRRIGGFSRGMRQRLGLAQALIHRPPVLFLDEPTSALDPAGRRNVLDLIGQLRGQTTIFLSSHILDDVERVCDTVGVIHEGQLLLVAGRDELLARYTSNAVVLEFDEASQPLLDGFAGRLQTLPWVANVTTEANSLRLAVNDVNQGKQALLPLVVAEGLVLNRYEWLRPTLEEVFLEETARDEVIE
ncbi:MAG: ABC transporter ATP-binding protein [Chloroflexi bacterium]|nr:ABC transporter ATP-binding protein [Chloroflexota bacterium]MCI0576471.1 ABC transporter ATP-binding protein [Chloroflexota bacterium]MCI0649553.1 ABC transporter ATP-binding protein [Chloroflexota bacterium]MCI0729371.1 ABC transporter ATP-binding protein [Chloroflexota bacterium]